MTANSAPEGTVLIIDDDAWTRFALARLMARRGWRVITAATLAEGLERLRSAPSCVILDLLLPDGDGEHVLRQIREAGVNARVIINTAQTDGAQLEEVRRLEPDAIIHKPAEFNRLLEACSA